MMVPERALNVRSAPAYHSSPLITGVRCGPARPGLTAGYNVIRLAMGSPFFTGGSGTINLGYIRLS